MAAAAARTKAKRDRGPDKRAAEERWERRHRAQSFIQGKELDELEMEVETGLYENVDISHGSSIPIVTAHILFSELTTICLRTASYYDTASLFVQWGAPYIIARTNASICRLSVVECI